MASIAGSLHIESNTALTNLTGLENAASIGGSLHIEGNHALINMTGLDNVTSIGSISIGGNAALTSLTGLENLTSLEGNLVIGWYDGKWDEPYGNPALESLTGLDNVTSIGGNLEINWNDALTSLTGLDNIDTGSVVDLSIWENISLSKCEVQSICDYLASPNGNISIGGNAPGCNSQNEVLVACETVSVEEINVSYKLFIYPNPSSTHITIELPQLPQKNTFLTIYNINSQQLLKQRITEQKTLVDVSGLSSGFYFAKIADDKRVMVSKLVKR